MVSITVTGLLNSLERQIKRRAVTSFYNSRSPIVCVSDIEEVFKKTKKQLLHKTARRTIGRSTCAIGDIYA